MLKDDFALLVKEGGVVNYAGLLIGENTLSSYLDKKDVEPELSILAARIFKRTRESIFAFSTLSPQQQDNSICRLKLRALHLYLFKNLNNIQEDMAVIFDRFILPGDVNDIASFIKKLAKKNRFSKFEVELLELSNQNKIGELFSQLITSENKLFVFTAQKTFFQIMNIEDDNLVKFSPRFCSINGMVCSEFYFFICILEILKTLQIYSKILVSDSGSPEIVDVEGLDYFCKIAEEFMDRTDGEPVPMENLPI